MAASTTTTTLTATVDADGRIVLPAEALRALRPDDERLTLLDVELSVEQGALVLRRSTIAEEDWWAYTPEHRAQLDRALSETESVKMSLDELERRIEDRGP